MARPISFDPETVLKAAMDLFWSRGYETVSVQDIVDATGLNRHSLYAHYGNKFGLLKAALAPCRDALLDRIREVLESGPGTPRERIRRLLTLRELGIADHGWQEQLDRSCFALRVSAELRDHSAELGRSLDAFGDAIEELLIAVVREGQELGEFRRDRTTEDLAAVLVSGFLLPLMFSPAAKHAEALLSMLD